MAIMNDVEWSMLLYYMIYYEKLKKIMQRTEKVYKFLAYFNDVACDVKDMLLSNNVQVLWISFMYIV